MSNALGHVAVCDASAIALAHQQAQFISAQLGFDAMQQAELCTVLLAVAQNALRYAGGGWVDFSLEAIAQAPSALAGDSALVPYWFAVLVADQGAGIVNVAAVLQAPSDSAPPEDHGLNLAACRALLPEFFQLTSSASGTQVRFGQRLPPSAPMISAAFLLQLNDALAAPPPATLLGQLCHQSHTLLTALQTQHRLEQTLANLQQELETTNHRMMALYLDLSTQAEQAKLANAALANFNYAISHDLRGPLRGIDGWSVALQEDCAEQLDEQGQVYLQRLRRDVLLMSQLIDDMLRLSRVTGAEIHMAPVDLAKLASNLITRLREQAPARQVSVSIQAPLHAHGDAALLEIALTNLLENAWKFTSKTPNASITFGCLPAAGPNGEVTYFVRDNGAGFDMAYVKKLFLPFQRLHSTEDFPGTGIGLAIVQRIVQRHGGRVWAEAELGKGASVYFELPAVTPPI